LKGSSITNSHGAELSLGGDSENEVKKSKVSGANSAASDTFHHCRLHLSTVLMVSNVNTEAQPVPSMKSLKY